MRLIGLVGSLSLPIIISCSSRVSAVRQISWQLHLVTARPPTCHLPIFVSFHARTQSLISISVFAILPTLPISGM